MLTTFETVDGRTLSYLRRGTGRLLVCVPGGPGLDPEAYFHGFAVPGCEILVFAPRGTGSSSAPGSENGYRMAGYIEDLEDLRVHLHEDRLTLYGNSYGGSIVLGYAAAHPDRIERLIISNTAARVDEEFEAAADKAQQRFIDNAPGGAERIATAEAADAACEQNPSKAASDHASRSWMACGVACEGAEERDYLDRLCSAPSNEMASKQMWVEWSAGLNLLDGADAITAPSLVLAGELDFMVPAAAVRTIAEALPNASYLELENVGHFPTVEAADQFRTIVAEFLKGAQRSLS